MTACISIHALREEGDPSGYYRGWFPEKFLSTPSARRATCVFKGIHPPLIPFLSTPSARRATVSASTSGAAASNFYPRPPRGGRPLVTALHNRTGRFLSTPSARRATLRFNFRWSMLAKFLSTPSARRATLSGPRRSSPCFISIHALREEGDTALKTIGDNAKKFLSTPSARRATATGETGWRASSNFYPRPPRGGRPGCHDHCERYAEFLSTPSARRATGVEIPSEVLYKFLSTPSARRATCLRPIQSSLLHISIHALREEGDAFDRMLEARKKNFYPRPPRGGRRHQKRPAQHS